MLLGINILNNHPAGNMKWFEISGQFYQAVFYTSKTLPIFITEISINFAGINLCMCRCVREDSNL